MRFNILNRLGGVHECDRRTDRQNRRIAVHRRAIKLVTLVMSARYSVWNRHCFRGVRVCVRVCPSVCLSQRRSHVSEIGGVHYPSLISSPYPLFLPPSLPSFSFPVIFYLSISLYQSFSLLPSFLTLPSFFREFRPLKGLRGLRRGQLRGLRSAMSSSVGSGRARPL